MTDRDYVKEEIRKKLTSDISNLSRSVDSTSLARQVDSSPLEKCMLHRYGQYKQGLARTVANDDEMEKARRKYGNGYRPAEMPLNMPFEAEYFDKYGRGYNGTAPTRIGEYYRCPGCGLQFATSMKLAPKECPVCHRITPIGQYVQDGYYKR